MQLLLIWENLHSGENTASQYHLVLTRLYRIHCKSLSESFKCLHDKGGYETGTNFMGFSAKRVTQLDFIFKMFNLLAIKTSIIKAEN